MGGNDVPVTESPRNVNARQSAMRVAILGVITLAVIIVVALFLIMRMG